MLTIGDAIALSMIAFVTGHFLGRRSLRRTVSKILHAEILLAAGFYTVAIRSMGKPKLMVEMVKALGNASQTGQIHPEVMLLARNRLAEIWEIDGK